MLVSRNVQLRSCSGKGSPSGAAAGQEKEEQIVKDGVPFPLAGTRAQARANAMYYAHIVEDTVVNGAPLQPGQTAFLKAQMWATLAATFPEDTSEEITIMADDQPTMVMAVPVQPRVEHIRAADDHTGVVTLTSAAWNVLRTLAVRNVLSSLNHTVTLDSAEWVDPLWELRVVWVAGSPTVQVFVDQT
jgi:hypothetical protein